MMRWRLPVTQEQTITCYNDLGKPETHGLEQRYVSPSTGICQKLVVQAVTPLGKHEVAISNRNNQASKIAMRLLDNSSIRWWFTFKWISLLSLFALKLLLSFVWLLVQIFVSAEMADDSWGDTEIHNIGYYKRYARRFSGQLWAARSPIEHSSRTIDEGEMDIPTRTLYPRLLIIHDPIRNEWVPCADRDIIIHTKFIAISFYSADAYAKGPDQETETAQFIEEVRAAVLGQKYNAYWLDLECVGKMPSEKNRDVYCMADVYRGAEMTLIILGKFADGESKCWRGWGERVWTMPEALLSPHLCYKFRDREAVMPLSLFQLANLAYTCYDIEQAIINAYSGKDPLERLERLMLLKSAIWRRNAAHDVYKAQHVYALMGFFEHRIQPNHSEDDMHALVRLSMANDDDRIVERMVSMLPSTITEKACWYSDDDIYGANLWDILPEIQVAGITENGALVVDGCRAAAIRWKGFPEVVPATTNSLKRSIIGFVPYLSWPIIISGLCIVTTNRAGDITLVVIGVVLLLVSPWLFVYSQSGRILSSQPWFIGVKGVISIAEAERHLYGAVTGEHFPRMFFTPSGSQFSAPEQGTKRAGSPTQYSNAKQADSGPDAGHIYTLIDTCSSTMYYFRAERPPTVCIFAGREGGLGRFVLCSERCNINELHKESVLRMPTEISDKMELCGWVALG
ncbi:uncharacterized protein BJ212DRAFT_657076 [Suillus subaureus]|uniref:Heterokaryon incompatibility domain-containing protein n=1 Tax=Suillus subaureus TaxID=48587 RepID=A0A9P7E1T2_9AGAM|nr:uncharacterized protein BJ212DRAFT_657076 [Suillus subaureus]KAG1808433.1 hypothetical protein BJ212DRAFT_657076 [Suillus subaureus]